MKRNICAAAVLLFTVTGALFAQVGKDNLAVLPFTGGVGNEGEAIAEQLSYDTNLNLKFGIIPRTSIASAIKEEQGFQTTSGMTDADTIAALGAQLGAKYVMAGNITALGSQKLLVVTIVRIETIQQVAGAFLTYNRIEDLPAKFSDMMKTLLPLLDVNTSSLPKLAVLPVQMQGGATNQGDADTLAQILAIYLLQNKSYAIYPRTSSLAQVQDEFKTQRSGVTADKNAAHSGYGVNPEYVLSVVSRKLGEMNMFNASIIDLAAGIMLEGTGTTQKYGTLSDGISAMRLIAKSLSGGKISAKEQKAHDELVSASTSAVEREEAAQIAARRSEERREAFKRKLWFGIGGYFDMHVVDVFAQSNELEHDFVTTTGTNDKGEETSSSNGSQKWLYGGKLGMDLGIRHFTIGAYFALAGYQAQDISKSDASDHGTASGMGLGGDFSIGYSIYNFFGDHSSRWPIGGTLRAGITLLHFFKNPLNVPTMFPYLQLSVVGGFAGGIRLELPVINGEVTPVFGLSVGLGYAWPMIGR
jgi:hypothetical protein